MEPFQEIWKELIVAFIPAALYQEGLLDAMIWSMAVRAKWAKEYFDKE